MISFNSIEIPNKFQFYDIKIPSGQMVGLFGGVNAGKSAMLLAILGQSIDDCSFVRYAEIETCDIAYVPTNASHLVTGMKSNLLGEMELSAQFLGRNIPDINTIAERFNVKHLLHRNPFELSGGELVRAGLAINAVKNPKIWLLDQIYDFLHPDSAKEIHDLLLRDKDYENTVVEAHSTMPTWSNDFDYSIFLDKNKNLNPSFVNNNQSKIGKNNNCYNKNIKFKFPLCKIENLEFKYKNDGFKLGPISAQFMERDIIAITGPNGSGKTTLLQCIANLNNGMTGRIYINGQPLSHKKKWLWARNALYCFQNPDDQLYKPTVLEEVITTLKALGREIPCNLEEQISSFGLENHIKSEPYHLSRPLKRMVCLAITLLSGSSVILLDEPTANLDCKLKEIVFKKICDISNNGSVVILVSHDLPFVSAIANRSLYLYDGKIQDHQAIPFN